MSLPFKKIIIASGPTLEPIDPVRFISNRSSGKTGFHLAMEAKARDIGPVVFISGPTCFLPAGVELVQVETALEMQAAIDGHFRQSEVVIMAAAVSDYRSRKYYTDKLKKDGERIVLELVRTPDILLDLGRRKRKNQLLVGFAAETEDIFANAQKKLLAKNLDLLVLNEISDSNPAFGSDENQVYLLRRDGIRKIEKTEKALIAAFIWDEILDLAGQVRGAAEIR
jgi:phosphopantothenoylcysteine decarboxylase/phosphopantothenate--cysteine ligase